MAISINNNILQAAYNFGRQYFYMPDLTSEDYDDQVTEFTEQAIEANNDNTTNDMSATKQASLRDTIKTMIINTIEEGFSIEADN